MHVQFAELPVSDQDRAIAFYVDKLGLTVAADVPMGKGGWRWVELALPGAVTRLHFIRQTAAPQDDPVLVLVDADVVGWVERLRARRRDHQRAARGALAARPRRRRVPRQRGQPHGCRQFVRRAALGGLASATISRSLGRSTP